MNIYVYLETADLANDRLIERLTILSEDHGLILHHTMDNNVKIRYFDIVDIDYIMGESPLSNYDDAAYENFKDKISDIISRFFDTYGTDHHIVWNIVNWFESEIGDVANIMSQILDDSLMVISEFKGIDSDLLDILGVKSYDDPEYLNWISTNRSSFETSHTDKLFDYEYAVTTFTTNGITLQSNNGDQYLMDEELTSGTPIAILYLVMYGYWLLENGTCLLDKIEV